MSYTPTASKDNGRSLLGLRVDVVPLLAKLVGVFAIVIPTLLLEDSTNSLSAIGYALLAEFILFFVLLRNDRRHSVFLSSALFINLNIALYVCINPHISLGSWRDDLYGLAENILVAKAYLVYSYALLCAVHVDEADRPSVEAGQVNVLVFAAGFLALVYALVFCFDRLSGSGVYVVNSNPLYEYAIVVFAVLWILSKEKSRFRLLLLIYAMLYIAQGVFYGDRSSAFPMMIILFMVALKRQPRLYQALFVILAGIIFANVIDIARNDTILSFGTIVEALERGIYSNTVSMSYYAGTAILVFKSLVSGGPDYFFSFIGSLFTGNSVIPSDLAVIARNYSSVCENKGGGLSSTYFYFWFGFVGCAVGGYLMGFLYDLFSKKDAPIFRIMEYCTVAFSLRWIVYFPIAFFRTCIIVPGVVYALIQVAGFVRDRVNPGETSSKHSRNR